MIYVAHHCYFIQIGFVPTTKHYRGETRGGHEGFTKFLKGKPAIILTPLYFILLRRSN